MDASAPARPPMAMTCQSFKSRAGPPKALPALRQSLLEEASFVPSSHRSQAGYTRSSGCHPPRLCIVSQVSFAEHCHCRMQGEMQHLCSCRHSGASAS